MNLVSFSKGKKTYLVILAGIALGVAEHYHVPIPWWANLALFALGGGALRKGVTDETAKAADDVAALIATVLPAISAPDAQTAALPPSVKLPSGRTVVLGKPSPAGQSPADEAAETKALNAAQASKR